MLKLLSQILESLATAPGSSSGPVPTPFPSANPGRSVTATVLDPKQYDPADGRYRGAVLSDACPLLLPSDLAAAGLVGLLIGPPLSDACTWSQSNGPTLRLTVARFIDEPHAARQLAAQVNTVAKHPWTALSRIGNQALLDGTDGRALVVSGTWYLTLSLSPLASSIAREQALTKLAAVVTANLP